jgi:hypothetical protein
MKADDEHNKKFSRAIRRQAEKTVFYPSIFAAFDAVSTEGAGSSGSPVLNVFLCQCVIPADDAACPARIAAGSDSDVKGRQAAKPVSQKANGAVGDTVSHHPGFP